jgi:tripartite ATP-independent transporter DctM subunit
MLRRGYKPQLALGTICASGTLGILIPPSVLTIVYAVTAQVSIGKMLIAGLVPGLLLATLYIGYIVVVGWLKPEWVPLDASVSRTPLKQKLLALKALVFPALLIVLILGSIFFGVATPTESAAVGVAGAMIPALIKRKLGIGMLRQSGVDTLKATSMILWITLGAKAYVAIFTGLGGADTLLAIIKGLDVEPLGDAGGHDAAADLPGHGAGRDRHHPADRAGVPAHRAPPGL